MISSRSMKFSKKYDCIFNAIVDGDVWSVLFIEKQNYKKNTEETAEKTYHKFF